MSAQLDRCPECGAGWPKGPDHALRGCGWLQGLRRHVSPSNDDVLIHDARPGRDRFLRFELKGYHEQWPPPAGQVLLLVALSKQPNWTVRVLRGTTAAAELYRVTGVGIQEPGIRTHTEAVRRAVDSWLGGSLWRDAEESIAVPVKDVTHTHGWARKGGVWTCIQDHYAIGHRPDTGCGQTLPQFP